MTRQWGRIACWLPSSHSPSFAFGLSSVCYLLHISHFRLFAHSHEARNGALLAYALSLISQLASATTTSSFSFLFFSFLFFSFLFFSFLFFSFLFFSFLFFSFLFFSFLFFSFLFFSFL